MLDLKSMLDTYTSQEIINFVDEYNSFGPVEVNQSDSESRLQLLSILRELPPEFLANISSSTSLKMQDTNSKFVIIKALFTTLGVEPKILTLLNSISEFLKIKENANKQEFLIGVLKELWLKPSTTNSDRIPYFLPLIQNILQKDNANDFFKKFEKIPTPRKLFALALNELDLDDLSVLCTKPYERGPYNGLVFEALKELNQNMTFSKEYKKEIILTVFKELKEGASKTKHFAHYEKWMMALGIIRYAIKVDQTQPIKNISTLYQEVFSTLTGIPSKHIYSQDTNVAKSINFLLVFHASFEENTGTTTYGTTEHDILKKNRIREQIFLLTKKLAKEGLNGLKKLRYETYWNSLVPNIPNETKKYWMETHEQKVKINDKDYKVLITDDPYRVLTWGIFLNCLAPNDFYDKQLAHLLFGQHQLILVVDCRNDEVIAGASVYLLFDEMKNPVICLDSHIYPQKKSPENFDNEIKKIVTEKAKKMNVRCIKIMYTCDEEFKTENLSSGLSVSIKLDTQNFLGHRFVNEFVLDLRRLQKEGSFVYEDFISLYEPITKKPLLWSLPEVTSGLSQTDNLSLNVQLDHRPYNFKANCKRMI